MSRADDGEDPAALSLDELHVLLDTVSAWRRTNTPEWRRPGSEAWAGYDPEGDPKSGPVGWLLLLGSAEAKLRAQLVRES